MPYAPIINILLIAIIVISAIWVYLDASRHKIGKIPDTGGLFNMSAGAWATVTLLIWIVGFPAYLLNRKSLLKSAHHQPVEVSGRGLKVAVFVLLGGFWLGNAIKDNYFFKLPACDDDAPKRLVSRIVESIPQDKLANGRFIGIKNVEQHGYDQQSETRSCLGTLVTSTGENGLRYIIQWNNREQREIRVQARISSRR
jgi:hypothetical protein